MRQCIFEYTYLRIYTLLGLKEFLERLSPDDPRIAAGIAARLK